MRGKNTVRDERSRLLRRIIVTSLLSALLFTTIIFVWLFDFYSGPLALIELVKEGKLQLAYFGLVFFGIWALIFYILWLLNRKKLQVMRAGIRGEDETFRHLRRLPDSFSVLRNVIVEERGRRSELDFVVVGPTGVFVVEAKAVVGRITGFEDSAEWLQVKENGMTKTLYNPCKQVTAQAERLKRVLGGDVPVRSVVFFSRAEAQIDVKVKSTPLFRAREVDSLIAYIERRPHILSAAEQKACLKVVAN
ncbi:MAG: nuclease-related domain-containing protein [Bacilli bacterium]